VSGLFHSSVALPPGKQSPTPAPEPIWTRWQREKFPAPAGNRNRSSP